MLTWDLALPSITAIPHQPHFVFCFVFQQEWAGYAEGLGASVYKAVKERNMKAIGIGVKEMLKKAAKPFASKCVEKAEEATGFDNQLPMEDDDETKANEVRLNPV
jgi:uncharacterized protein YjaZ